MSSIEEVIRQRDWIAEKLVEILEEAVIPLAEAFRPESVAYLKSLDKETILRRAERES